MSEEARREYYFAKRAKYLINCLTTERYRRCSGCGARATTARRSTRRTPQAVEATISGMI
jgi:hypothetical protein